MNDLACLESINGYNLENTTTRLRSHEKKRKFSHRQAFFTLVATDGRLYRERFVKFFIHIDGLKVIPYEIYKLEQVSHL